MAGFNKFKRISKVVSILSKFGFDEIVDRLPFDQKPQVDTLLKKNKDTTHAKKNIYERIRLALEDLGPTYIKLGQLLSNREDLIPKELVKELEQLQDNVPPEPVNIYEFLQLELGIEVNDHFKSIDAVPFAAASISQVYKGTLINGQEVIIKVKRSNIQQTITADLSIIKDIAQLLEKQYKKIKEMNLFQIVISFENSIMKELSFINELHNVQKFEKNFEGNNSIYVPKTFPDLSNNNILVMEFIDGFKINDRTALAKYNIEVKAIVQKGMDLFMKQVLEDGFFHADPHPGNIFINSKGQIIFIDFGAMGSMMPSDQAHIENFVIDFAKKNPQKLIKTIKKMAISYHINDEHQLARDINDMFELIESSNLSQLDPQIVFEKLNRMLQNNNILMPEYIYILIRGITLIEGIGKQLDADLNLGKSIAPYAKKIALKRISPKFLLEKGFHQLDTINDLVQEIPNDLSDLIDKINNDKLQVTQNIAGINHLSTNFKKGFNRIAVSIVILSLTISSAIIVLADKGHKIYEVPTLALIGFIMSTLLTAILIISIVRNK